jgi:hypothetical protein
MTIVCVFFASFPLSLFVSTHLTPYNISEMLQNLDVFWRIVLTTIITAQFLGCATVNISPDEIARQAQEQRELQDGLNTHVLVPGSHLGTFTP